MLDTTKKITAVTYNGNNWPVGGGGGGRLPAAYQEVQYITGTGTQYIDTGVQASSDINSCIKFSATQTGSFKVLGIFESEYHTDVFDMDSSRFRFTNYGEAWYGGTISADTSWHYVVLRDKDGQYIFDDIVRKTKTNTWSSSLNYYIFNSNGDNIPGRIRLSSLRMYRNSTDALIRDFVPCYRVSDREAGLYDLVSATFFTNDGTGDFLIGPKISGGIIQPISITANGTFTPPEGTDGYAPINVNVSGEDVTFGTFTMPDTEEALDINIGFQPRIVNVYVKDTNGRQTYGTAIDWPDGTSAIGSYFQTGGYGRTYSIPTGTGGVTGHVIALLSTGFRAYAVESIFANRTAYYVAVGTPTE